MKKTSTKRIKHTKKHKNNAIISYNRRMSNSLTYPEYKFEKPETLNVDKLFSVTRKNKNKEETNLDF